MFLLTITTASFDLFMHSTCLPEAISLTVTRIIQFSSLLSRNWGIAVANYSISLCLHICSLTFISYKGSFKISIKLVTQDILGLGWHSRPFSLMNSQFIYNLATKIAFIVCFITLMQLCQTSAKSSCNCILITYSSVPYVISARSAIFKNCSFLYRHDHACDTRTHACTNGYYCTHGVFLIGPKILPLEQKRNASSTS